MLNCCTTALYPCAPCWAQDVFNQSQVSRLEHARLRGYGGLVPARVHKRKRFDDNLDGYTHLEERSHNG